MSSDGDEIVADLDEVEVLLNEMNEANDALNCQQLEYDEALHSLEAFTVELSQRLKQMYDVIEDKVRPVLPYFEISDRCKELEVEIKTLEGELEVLGDKLTKTRETMTIGSEFTLAEGDRNNNDNTSNSRNILESLTAEVSAKRHQLSDQQSTLCTNLCLLDELRSRHRHTIAACQPYFTTRQEGDGYIAQQNQRLHALKGSIATSRRRYEQSRHQLSALSEDVHKQRSQRQQQIIQHLKDAEDRARLNADQSSFTHIPDHVKPSANLLVRDVDIRHHPLSG